MAKSAKSNSVKSVSKVSNKKSSRKATKKVAPAITNVVEQVKATTSQLLIVTKHLKNGRWYVFFQGVKPENNVGCGCKTAKSALRYMLLLKNKYGAVISNNCYERLRIESLREA